MANFLTKNIPNSITCCNLISGSIATWHAFQEEYEATLTFIIIGAVFDFFDGFSARLLRVSSPIGKELDSLADDITFGLAPSAMVYSFFQQQPICNNGDIFQYLPYTAFLIAAFSALRLAKFNLDERQTSSFIGLPTPANALFWGAFIISMQDFLTVTHLGANVLILLILLSCWILIAEIPMFALKFKSFDIANNKTRYLFIASSILIIIVFLLFLHSIAGIWITILWYIALSLLTRNKKQRHNNG